MSYEFEELCKSCNIQIPFVFKELDPLYTVYFPNSDKPFRLYKNLDKLAAQFEGIEPNFKERFIDYLEQCERIFNSTINRIVKSNFNSLTDYMKHMMGVDPTILPVLAHSFWQEICRHFESTEARELLSLVSFFLGRTPFNTMGIYTLLSYTEFLHDGYYNVEGGMYKIVEGLQHELEKKGVTIHLNEEIIGYSQNNNKVNSFITNTGKEIQANTYVVNNDAANFRYSILKRKNYSEKRMDKKKWTMGFLTAYVGIDKKLNNIEHHNYFLGANYRNYAHNLSATLDDKQKPYYYVNVLSKNNKECAPEGCESLFFVCPVPNLMAKSNWDDANIYVDAMIADFSNRIGVDLTNHIKTKHFFTPDDWTKKYNLYKGAGLGLAHTMMQIGYFRPSNKDEELNNLFYVGSSTIPGAGLPMGVISSKLVVDQIRNYKH